MTKIPNKLVIFGAVAAAALTVPGVLSPLMFEEAYADHRGPHRNNQEVTQFARDNVLALQAGVNANVDADVRNNNVCVIATTCTTN